MTLRMALRSLAAQPVRSAVLACGFGLGIASMAGLLGVGEVILEQSRSPSLRGGGDLYIYGITGRVQNARFLTEHVLGSPPLGNRIAVAAPSMSERLYLVTEQGRPIRVRARGGIPSLERTLGDPETSGVASWTDTPEDEAWVRPDPGALLRAMDRFHPIPDVPQRADSWAEWLYFNGKAGDNQFYLTFMVGPDAGDGMREAGVRLQLERGGRRQSFAARARVDAAEVLRHAPDLRIGENRVALDGTRYRIDLSLPGVTGTLWLEGEPGNSMPPFEVGGAAGWRSGYVVPVLSGRLEGELVVEGRRVALNGGQGYHDHNWGFWEGVTWQWGQVAGQDVSLVYGRIRPPADAADPSRIPGVLAALGPSGPLGYTSQVVIEETDDEAGRPVAIRVRGGGQSLLVEMDFRIEETVSNPLGSNLFGGGEAEVDFLQFRGRYRVSGTVAGRPIDFEAEGSAETFRLR